jgi:hypothetical protein
MKDDSYERIDRMWETKAYEDRGMLKAKIKVYLEDNHPNDISYILNIEDDEVLKIVHEIYRDGGLMKPQHWESEHVGDDLWAIYGKDRAGEYIDENGDYLGFDTKEEADEYIRGIK